MLISCRHEQTTVGYVLRQHYTLNLCTTLGFFVKEKRLTSPTVNNCSTISGNQSESNVLVGGGQGGGKKELLHEGQQL